jgi:hypothetical protein
MPCSASLSASFTEIAESMHQTSLTTIATSYRRLFFNSTRPTSHCRHQVSRLMGDNAYRLILPDCSSAGVSDIKARKVQSMVLYECLLHRLRAHRSAHYLSLFPLFRDSHLRDDVTAARVSPVSHFLLYFARDVLRWTGSGCDGKRPAGG